MHRFFTICFVFLFCFSASGAELGEDGLHKQKWFSKSFRDVAEDIVDAADAGKRLVLIFEQRGCIYCRKLHEEVLSAKKVSDFIKKNFVVIQYNLFGDEEVIDLDGTNLTEKTAARKWRVIYTPTIMLMPKALPGNGNAGQAAVSTMPGAFGKGTTLDMFQWVLEEGYSGEEHFQKYHARKIAERRIDAGN